MQKYAADVSAILETSEAHFTLFSPKEFHSREINVLGNLERTLKFLMSLKDQMLKKRYFSLELQFQRMKGRFSKVCLFILYILYSL